MSGLSSALSLVQHFPVFPCLENKGPATPHGFKDASQEPAAVRALWRCHPGPLIGVPTGGVSGFDVLDIDPRHGGMAWLENNLLPEILATRRHQTRSDGLHILFRHSDGVRNTASKIAPGVDTRGDGGYIVFWPAEGLPVENPDIILDWPPTLLEALTYKRPPPNYAPPANLKARTKLIERVIGNALFRLESAQAGQRHYQLRAAACTIGGVLDVSGISFQDAHSALVAAAKRAGAEDLANADKTATWGLQKGRETPLTFGTQNHGG